MSEKFIFLSYKLEATFKWDPVARLEIHFNWRKTISK